jgi:hypothetical protein
MQLIHLLFFGLGLSFATNSSKAEEYESIIHLASIIKLNVSISKRYQKIEKTKLEINGNLEWCMNLRNLFLKTSSKFPVFDENLNLECKVPEEYSPSKDCSAEEVVENPNPSISDKLKDTRKNKLIILLNVLGDAKSEHTYWYKELNKILEAILYYQESLNKLGIDYVTELPPNQN